jgi:hypothetical protein
LINWHKRTFSISAYSHEWKNYILFKNSFFSSFQKSSFQNIHHKKYYCVAIYCFVLIYFFVNYLFLKATLNILFFTLNSPRKCWTLNFISDIIRGKETYIHYFALRAKWIIILIKSLSTIFSMRSCINNTLRLFYELVLIKQTADCWNERFIIFDALIISICTHTVIIEPSKNFWWCRRKIFFKIRLYQYTCNEGHKFLNSPVIEFPTSYIWFVPICMKVISLLAW